MNAIHENYLENILELISSYDPAIKEELLRYHPLRELKHNIFESTKICLLMELLAPIEMAILLHTLKVST